MFDKRAHGEPFSGQELRDPQMWFNLAWFGEEFRKAPVKLITGETVSIAEFVEQGKGFSANDLRRMVDDQYKILKAVVPIHRHLQDTGQIEVTTSPLYHPILPLIIDTDDATVDLEGASLPARFSCLDDARAQVRRAADDYGARFGRKPRGMWPAEGAISPRSIPVFARQEIDWIATDRGVLARSGRWGYDVLNPDLVCQPHEIEKDGTSVAVFFRDTPLSDAIGFRYPHAQSAEAAVRDLVSAIASVEQHTRVTGTSASGGPETELVGIRVTFKQVPGLTRDRLAALVGCHLARAAAVGFEMPEMSYCPLAIKGASASVAGDDSALSVTIVGDGAEATDATVERGRVQRPAFWVAASGLALLTGAMGCVCAGYSGVIGLAVGYCAGLVPLFLPALLRRRRQPSLEAKTSQPSP